MRILICWTDYFSRLAFCIIQSRSKLSFWAPAEVFQVFSPYLSEVQQFLPPLLRQFTMLSKLQGAPQFCLFCSLPLFYSGASHVAYLGLLDITACKGEIKIFATYICGFIHKEACFQSFVFPAIRSDVASFSSVNRRLCRSLTPSVPDILIP